MTEQDELEISLIPSNSEKYERNTAPVGFEPGPFGWKLNRLLVVVEGWDQF